MHDARDAEDTRLLAAREFNALLESYFETIIQRCRVRCRTEDDALDCAQAVFLRLLRELKRGRHYPVPFRVVVNNVIGWTVRGFYQRGRAILVEFDDDLPDEVFHGPNPYSDWETRYDLERALGEVSPGDREIGRLRFLEGEEIEDIARRLGKERNAVDQAIYRVRTKLRDVLG